MIFLGKKQNTTLLQHLSPRGENGSAVGRARGGAQTPHPPTPAEQIPPIHVSRPGASTRRALKSRGKKGTRRCLSASALQTSVQSNVKNRGYNNRYEKNTLLYTLVSTLAEELTGAKYMSSRRLPTNDALEPSRMRPDSTELSRKP